MTKNPNSINVNEIFSQLENYDRELFLYSGYIDQRFVDKFLGSISSNCSYPKISLILTTFGGDPDQAYRMASILKKLFSGTFRVIVVGPCKSSGTLVAVGADELSFGLFGELGPLDVQLTKQDEIGVFSSGLDTLGALEIICDKALKAFKEYMIDIIRRSRSAVSMKTASDVAAQLVVGLFQPMVQQVDPHKLSEVNRKMEIAREYGRRLGMSNLKGDKEKMLDRLVKGYPSHGFIIDKDEAETIFEKVFPICQFEQQVTIKYPEEAFFPSSGEPKIINIRAELEKLKSQDEGNMPKS